MENPNKLPPEVVTQIPALARQIIVAHQLALEIQAELAAHLEKKVLGYLSGQEKISPTDALQLTRSHFGDAGVIKSLLQRVHAVGYHLSLARRLAIAAMITLVVPMLMWPIRLVYLYVIWSPMLEKASKPDAEPLHSLPLTLCGLALTALTSALLVWAFVALRRRLNRLPWGLQNWRLSKLGEMLFVLYTAYAFGTVWWIYHPSYYGVHWAPTTPTEMFWGFLPTPLVTDVPSVFLWLW